MLEPCYSAFISYTVLFMCIYENETSVYAVVKSYMIFIHNYIRLVYIFGCKFEDRKMQVSPTKKMDFKITFDFIKRIAEVHY